MLTAPSPLVATITRTHCNRTPVVFTLTIIPQKINHFIDEKTAWVAQLDRLNIPKNEAAGIHPPPKDAVAGLSGAISGAIGAKLQAASPLITFVTNKITASSAGGHGGGLLGGLGGILGGSSGGGAAGGHAGSPGTGLGGY